MPTPHRLLQKLIPGFYNLGNQKASCLISFIFRQLMKLPENGDSSLNCIQAVFQQPAQGSSSSNRIIPAIKALAS